MQIWKTSDLSRTTTKHRHQSLNEDIYILMNLMRKKDNVFFFVLSLSSLQLELRTISQGHPIFIAHLLNHSFNKYILENLLRAWRYTLPGLSLEFCLLLQRALGTGHKGTQDRGWHLSAVKFLDRDARGPGNIQGSESVLK